MFFCIYCRTMHPEGWRAREHVVPRKLGNRSYVHKATCAAVNRALEVSVERPFHSKTTAYEWLLVHGPPKGLRAKRIDSMSTTDGVEYHRYWDGRKYTLAKSPVFESTNAIPVRAENEDGTVSEYWLKLPFSITSASEASPIVASPEKLRQRKHQKDIHRVREYVEEVWSNPKLDPGLHEFATSHGLAGPPDLHSEVRQINPPGEGFVENLTPAIFKVEKAVVAMYLIKIAYLHASNAVGNLVESDPIAEFNRRVVRGCCFHGVAPNLDFVSPLEGVKGDGPFYAVQNWAEAERWALGDGIGLKFGRLIVQHIERCRSALKFIEIMDWSMEADIGPELIAETNFHTLSLERGGFGLLEGTYCRVSLFGGQMAALVPVSQQSPTLAQTRAVKEILFSTGG